MPDRWSSALIVSTICCLPFALLCFLGAPWALADMLVQPSPDQPLLVGVALITSHLVAVVGVLFAVAGYAHWARRASEPALGKGRMPAAAVQARNRKAAATGLDAATESHALPAGQTLQPRSVTYRMRARTTGNSVNGGGSPIVDELDLQRWLRSEREQRFEQASSDFRRMSGGFPSPPLPALVATPVAGTSMGSPLALAAPAPAACSESGGGGPPSGSARSPASMAIISRGGAGLASCIGAGLTNSSPFLSSPYGASPPPGFADGSPFAAGQAKRRLNSTGADGGSGNKYQRALYIPSSSDTQEDPSVIARRASDLLQLLRLVDTHTGSHHMPAWRDNLRMWVSALVLRPVAELLAANEKLVQEAAAKGAVAAAPGGMGFGPTTTFGGAGLFGPKAAAPAAAAAAPAPGQAMPVPKWLQHPHADEKSQALVHQYNKLSRFKQLAGFAAESALYVQQRIGELAQGQCMASYKWDGGGMRWNSSLPMDSELLLHLFATFLDTILAPAIAQAAPASALGAPGGSSMFGGSSLGGSTPGGVFGGSMLGAAPSTSPFANPMAAAKPAAKTGVFWRLPADFPPSLLAFSSRHIAKAADKQRVKSDVVVLHQHHIPPVRRSTGGVGSWGSPLGVAVSSTVDGASSGNGTKRAPPRYSLLCDGAEWVVAQGEHNAWDVLVLFMLHRAKRNGALGGLDLNQEAFTSFKKSITAEATAQLTRPDTLIVGYGALSILQPWSQALEDLSLDAVKQGLA